MNRIVFLLIIAFCSASVMGQDMRKVFVSMPDSITPLLTKVNKEDCIDFLDSDMKAVVKNRFGNEAEMKALTDDYVLLQMTAVSTLEMKLFPVNDSTKIVCMVKTVCASACDSEIHFYNADWDTELNVDDYLHLPEVAAFFLLKDVLTEEEELIMKKADVKLMKASLSSGEPTITFEYVTPKYMNQEDREKLQPLLRKEPLVFRWKNGQFEY